MGNFASKIGSCAHTIGLVRVEVEDNRSFDLDTIVTNFARAKYPVSLIKVEMLGVMFWFATNF